MKTDSAEVSRLVPLTRVALFTASAVAGGYLLAAVPNVELITLVVALAGVLFGRWSGMLTGALSMIIYGGLNAWGIPFLPVWLTQVIAMGFTGFIFGSTGESLKSSSVKKKYSLFVLLGGLTTFLYDLLTNLAFPLVSGVAIKSWWAYLLAGLPFMIVHVGSNILIFALIAPTAYCKLVDRFR